MTISFMFYMANFDNESAKDAARLGLTAASLGAGAAAGAQLGTYVDQVQNEQDLQQINDELNKTNISSDERQAEKVRKKQREQNIARAKKSQIFEEDSEGRFRPKDVRDKRKLGEVLDFSPKPKQIGAGVGGLGLAYLGSQLGDKLFPNKRFEDPGLYEGVKEKRREVSSTNQMSKEARGWLTAAQRMKKMKEGS